MLVLSVAALSLFGCATVMSQGCRNGLSADAQELSAEILKRGMESFGETVRGKEVSIKILEERARGRHDAELFYAGELLRETVISEGGRYVGESGGDIRLEIYWAKPGVNATERNIAAPVSENVNLPMFYSEGMDSEASIIILARDSKGKIIPMKVRGTNGETLFYLFRAIGPFQR